MNTDKHELKRIVSSAFIGVDRRLKMFFSDFFSTLLRNELHYRIDAQRSELNIAARMVLRLGGQPPHLNDLPRVPALQAALLT